MENKFDTIIQLQALIFQLEKYEIQPTDGFFQRIIRTFEDVLYSDRVRTHKYLFHSMDILINRLITFYQRRQCSYQKIRDDLNKLISYINSSQVN